MTFFQRFGYHVPWQLPSGEWNWAAVVGDLLFALSGVILVGAGFVIFFVFLR